MFNSESLKKPVLLFLTYEWLKIIKSNTFQVDGNVFLMKSFKFCSKSEHCGNQIQSFKRMVADV